MTLEEFITRLDKVRKSGAGYIARCPAHEDKSPSLSISSGEKGIIIKCQAGCRTDDVCAALGLKLSDLFSAPLENKPERKQIVATYDYTDENGALLFQAVRYFPKDFRQRKPDGKGGWEYSLKDTRRVLYRLLKVLEGVKKGLPILLVEGERDTGNLCKLGFTATTCPMGAGKWLPDYSESLRGATVYIIPDRDEPGRKHAETVLVSLKGIAQSVRVVDLPELHNGRKIKDVTDFIEAGADAGQITELIDRAGVRDQAKRLFDLESRADSDRDELLKSRYLCRGGGILLVAPTGIGKSTLLMQSLICWALGRDFFGIEPAKPLTSLLIQAENDDGDLAEMRDGVVHGLRLSPIEINAVKSRLFVYSEDTKTGPELVALADRLIEHHKPDLFALDPALSYLGGESNSQKDVGGFLRNQLNPVLHRHRCGCVIVHHGNKPSTGKEKGEWQAGDFAYLGAGSAEWANWARAVLAIRSIGSHSVYELRAGKRGARLGWKDNDGSTSYSRLIGHSLEPGFIYWREADESEITARGRPKEYADGELLDLLPAEGLNTKEWKESAGHELGIKDRRFFQLSKALKDSGLVIKSHVNGKWQPIKKSR